MQLFFSMQPFLVYNYRCAFGKIKSDFKGCFHVLGVDILIDENLKPWLLEINANPSFNIEHDLEISNEKEKMH